MNFQAPQKISLEMRLALLREKLSHVPQKPGVYLHKGNEGEILYVGKAKNLNSRLKSYFTSLDRQTPKTRALVERVFDFEIIVTENEYESLILECNLIKHNQPNYNILLRDDKTYPYIRIDMHEDWPRVMTTRKRKKDGALYFGPYSISGQIQQLMGVFNRFFPLVKCTPTFFKTVTRPCNYYDIKRCLGPCKLPVKKEEYFSHLNSVINILNGKFKDISKNIKENMLNAAKELEFEKAALYREQLKALEALLSQQSVNLNTEIELDIIGSYWNEELVTFYVTNIRDGKVIGGYPNVVEHLIEEPTNEDELNPILKEKSRIYTAFLSQYYEKKFIPKSILFDKTFEIFSIDDVNLINEFLINKKNNDDNSKNEQIFSIKSEDYFSINKIKDKILIKKIVDLVKLSYQNAENKFHEQSKIDEFSNKMLTSLMKFLNLASLPINIECYDISTFQGAQTVAAQVVFKNGKASKKDYKKYIIKETIGHNDDFASLREVIRRRFKENEKSHLPSLIIIDGGAPQIREVAWMLHSLGLKTIPVIGIAKSRIKNKFYHKDIEQSLERLIVPKRNSLNEILPNSSPDTIILTNGSLEYRLVTQMRDEAHRFAITFHRKKRDKLSIKSIITDVKGLGSKRRKKLLESFPNLNELLNENIQTVSKKTGIPTNIIQAIIEKLKTIS
ncbi:excinuclease ABC subunit UvrC [Fluviispira multicolorata]|uniref:UvrABC system protein C n=1 Tax=Fluviispira multicolorata TaxID=2654512 RepID=A0A833JBN0_9BACT|nr:excinuclease ABC subunit UvrC [Fluviispira multicolorata]KAB8029728.1 excinuclease ABC subunit UvrC [Fluviispira multicolorata]